mgnify:CR=1 FL=1
MLLRFDPFREIDRFTEGLFGNVGRSPWMPMDAYRKGDHVEVHFDLPGIDPGSIDLSVDRNTLTVTAEFDDVNPAVSPRFLFDGTYVGGQPNPASLELVSDKATKALTSTEPATPSSTPSRSPRRCRRWKPSSSSPLARMPPIRSAPIRANRGA